MVLISDTKESQGNLPKCMVISLFECAAPFDAVFTCTIGTAWLRFDLVWMARLEAVLTLSDWHSLLQPLHLQLMTQFNLETLTMVWHSFYVECRWLLQILPWAIDTVWRRLQTEWQWTRKCPLPSGRYKWPPPAASSPPQHTSPTINRFIS